ncbi:serine/threonine-protein phosphatase 6 regulatory ankyrin repeat subunit A-like [Oncorhynchus tshawytscha]|uniref:serine/threonine-protein phosphatase 6 regulatory ankyrin repeat subunit A-like n=1 Tax=Oncorhynchus tshawytscha TaxID=74940 RepID=UPI001C3C73AA|nr:serine/threonine-protein phosphatase 6 regulatory ankyrin repeat subunit A-like [Oncorhynchus tshawytscha]
MDLQLVSEDLEKAVSTAVGQDKHGTDILNDSDVRAPISPLHLAAYHSPHYAMEVLVQSLLDLDVRDSQGRTPLDLAALKSHVECVDVLINQEASILVKDFTLKRTPIHAAAWLLPVCNMTCCRC